MMRKLAIASLLVAGVALSGSVLAQEQSTAPAPTSTPAAAKHTHHHKSSTHKKAHTKAHKKTGSEAHASGMTASGK